MFGARQCNTARVRREVQTMASHIQATGSLSRSQQKVVTPSTPVYSSTDDLTHSVTSSLRVAAAATMTVPAIPVATGPSSSGMGQTSQDEQMVALRDAVVSHVNTGASAAPPATAPSEAATDRTESWFGQRVWTRVSGSQPSASSSGRSLGAQPTLLARGDGESIVDSASVPSSRPQAWSFSVMCYNILADTYAHHFANKLYRDVPRSCLDWSFRRSLLLEEILHWAPDVVCLQEVQHFNDLEPEMRAAGYEGKFMRRTGRRRDGCATFWRSDRLRACSVHRLDFAPLGLDDNVAMLLSLAPLLPGEKQAGAGAGAAAANRVSAGGGGGGGGGNGESGGSGRANGSEAAGVETTSSELDSRAAAALSSVRLLVATTHITFDPAKGDVKLGQVRTLLHLAQQLATNPPPEEGPGVIHRYPALPNGYHYNHHHHNHHGHGHGHHHSHNGGVHGSSSGGQLGGGQQGGGQQGQQGHALGGHGRSHPHPHRGHQSSHNFGQYQQQSQQEGPGGVVAAPAATGAAGAPQTGGLHHNHYHQQHALYSSSRLQYRSSPQLPSMDEWGPSGDTSAVDGGWGGVQEEAEALRQRRSGLSGGGAEPLAASGASRQGEQQQQPGVTAMPPPPPAEGGPLQTLTIITGDFNSIAGSPLYQYLAQGSLDLSHTSRKKLSGQLHGVCHTQYKPIAEIKQLHAQLTAADATAATAANAAAPAATADAAPLVTATAASPPLTPPATPREPQSKVAAAAAAAQRLASAAVAAANTAAAAAASACAAAAAAASYPLLGSPAARAANATKVLDSYLNTVKYGLERWTEKELKYAMGDQYTGTLCYLPGRGSMQHLAAAAVATGGCGALGGCGGGGGGRRGSTAGVAPSGAGGGSGGGGGGGCRRLPRNYSTPVVNRSSADGVVAAAAVLGGGGRFLDGHPAADKAPATEEEEPSELVVRHPLRLRSSYVEVAEAEPAFTSIHSGFMGTVDFILYTGDPTREQQPPHQRQQQPQARRHVRPPRAPAPPLEPQSAGVQQADASGGVGRFAPTTCSAAVTRTSDPHPPCTPGTASPGGPCTAAAVASTACGGTSGAQDGGGNGTQAGSGYGSTNGGVDAGDGAGGGAASNRSEEEAVRFALVPVAVLQPPDVESLPRGLPAERWGSDHVSIVTRFELRPV